MLCARVVRGISSTEKEVAPVAAIFLDGLHVAERPQEADQDLAPPQQRKIGLAGHVVGAVTQHLKNDVGRAKYLGALGHDLGALGDVVGIRVAGFDAGAGFNDDFQSGFFQVGNDCRYERNPPLPWKGLAGNTDDHGDFLYGQAQNGELSILPAQTRMCTGTCGRRFQNGYPCLRRFSLAG